MNKLIPLYPSGWKEDVRKEKYGVRKVTKDAGLYASRHQLSVI